MSKTARSIIAIVALFSLGTVALVGNAGATTTRAAHVTAVARKKKPKPRKVSPLKGNITVFAAASLTEAFQAEANVIHFLAPGININLNFAGSQTLVQQIEAGAPADVVATADEASMRSLSIANQLQSDAFLFAHNRLTMLVEKGNPKNIQSLSDLARPDVTVSLCAPVVPCGKFAAQILANAKVTVTPVSQEADVKGVVTKVSTGAVDAGITYVTDALAAKATTDSVRIPDENNVINAYPIAVPRTARDVYIAKVFILFLFSPLGQFVLAAHGFLLAS